MELVCINNNPIKVNNTFSLTPILTIGKSYKILDTRNSEFFILDDTRSEIWIPKYYFK